MTVLNDPTQLFKSFKTKVVEFPAADGLPSFSIKLRELTADEFRDVAEKRENPKPEEQFIVKLIHAGAIKDDGSPLFASIEGAMALPKHVADKLVDELGALNSLWVPASQSAEETLKNSDATKTSDSDTSSD